MMVDKNTQPQVELPLMWRRFQLDSNGITSAHVTTYVNEDGEMRGHARMELTENEARYLINEIEHAIHVIAEARAVKGDVQP